MNYLPKSITVLCIASCSMGLFACSEKQSSRGEKPKTVESEEKPSIHPLPTFEQKKILIAEPSGLKKDKETEQEQIEQVLLAQSKASRAIVFDVPLDEAASVERAKAWDALTQKESWMLLSDAQCQFAKDLLDRYENGTQLEKLVFWRLVFLRNYEQGASSTSRIVGSNEKLRSDLRKKISEMLYSGLGDDSEKLPEPLAARKAVSLLEKAGKKKN